MSVRWLVQHTALRTAPDSLRRRLRELDPTAEIVYMGEGTWLVGKVRWNTHVMLQCVHMIENATAMLASGRAKGLSRNGTRKIQLALLGLQGFRPVAEYQIVGEPDGRIVEDFRRSQWEMLHTSDDQLIDSIMAQQDEKAIAAEKDLADPHRAHEAWRYAFTRSHGVTDYAKGTTPKSGRTLIKSVA